MQSQLTVRLPDDLRRALTAASREMQRKNSDVVRLALRQFLALPPVCSVRAADRVRHLVGSVASGVPDLARRHRAYIVKSLKNAGELRRATGDAEVPPSRIRRPSSHTA